MKKVLNPFTLDTIKHSALFAITCPEKTRTIQAGADELNINYIMRKFGQTGELPYGLTQPEYGNFLNVETDFQTLMNLSIEANQHFYDMPSKLRKRFNNDPTEFMSFLQDNNNYDEAVKLGIVIKPQEDIEPTSSLKTGLAHSPKENAPDA